MHSVEGHGLDVIQRDDADNSGSQCYGYLGIVNIGDVPLAAAFKMVNGRMKRLTDLARRAGKIDYHSTRIDHVDLKPMRLEPACDRLQILLRQSEPLSEFRGADPSVEVRRALRMKLINKLLKFALLFWRAAQLQ